MRPIQRRHRKQIVVRQCHHSQSQSPATDARRASYRQYTFFLPVCQCAFDAQSTPSIHTQGARFPVSPLAALCPRHRGARSLCMRCTDTAPRPLFARPLLCRQCSASFVLTDAPARHVPPHNDAPIRRLKTKRDLIARIPSAVFDRTMRDARVRIRFSSLRYSA